MISLWHGLLLLALAISWGNGKAATPVSFETTENVAQADGDAGCGCGSDALSRNSAGGGQSGGDSQCTDGGSQGGGEASRQLSDVATDQQGETAALASLIDLPGGCFNMGSNRGLFKEDGEGPQFEVCLSPFRIGKYEVSAARFAEFVKQTNHTTESETFGNSFVVEQFVSEKLLKTITNAVAAAPWWIPVNGASWKHPEGPDTDLKGRMNHPATHISWNDALAFCRWSAKGGRLPTEAEWEYASRGGKNNRLFPWGNRPSPKRGKHRLNIWQSELATDELNAWSMSRQPQTSVRYSHRFYSAVNIAQDGYKSTAPVDSYGPNKFGLYNTVGNVWEWTNDWWTPDRSGYPKQDPQGPATGKDKTKKGGSFMCHTFTCYRYRNAARMHVSPDSGALNIGFRCAADALPKESDK